MIVRRTVVLDNEAVQVLLDLHHPKHRRLNAIMEAVIRKRKRHPDAVHLVVPTSVRVEAGWNRTDPRAAGINRLSIRDHELDERAANLAATIRSSLGISVADAHLGVVLQQTRSPHTVYTSDASDVRRISVHLGTRAEIVTV
jgi:hypothetical protein